MDQLRQRNFRSTAHGNCNNTKKRSRETTTNISISDSDNTCNKVQRLHGNGISKRSCRRNDSLLSKSSSCDHLKGEQSQERQGLIHSSQETETPDLDALTQDLLSAQEHYRDNALWVVSRAFDMLALQQEDDNIKDDDDSPLENKSHQYYRTIIQTALVSMTGDDNATGTSALAPNLQMTARATAMLDTFLDAMKRHPHSLTVQVEACRFLQRLLVVQPSGCADANERQASSSSPRDELLRLQDSTNAGAPAGAPVTASGTTSPTATPILLDYFWKRCGQWMLFQAMENFSDNVTIALLCLDILQRCLRFYDCNPSPTTECGRTSTPAASRASTTTSASSPSDIQAPASQTTPASSFCEQTDSDDHFTMTGATISVVRALSYHEEQVSVQRVGWSLLAHMVRNGQCRHVIWKLNGHIVDWIIHILQLHSNDTGLQCNAAATLCWLVQAGGGAAATTAQASTQVLSSTNSESALLHAERHVPALLNILKMHADSSTVFGNIICLLCGVTLPPTSNDDGNMTVDALKTVVQGMLRHTNSAKVQEGCLRWIRLFLNTRERNRPHEAFTSSNNMHKNAVQKLLLDCISITLAVMTIHRDVSHLQCQACDVIVALMQDDDSDNAMIRQRLMELPMVDAALVALKLHGSSNMRLQLHVALFLTTIQQVQQQRELEANDNRNNEEQTRGEDGGDSSVPESSLNAGTSSVTTAFGGGLGAMVAIWKLYGIAADEE